MSKHTDHKVEVLMEVPFHSYTVFGIDLNDDLTLFDWDDEREETLGLQHNEDGEHYYRIEIDGEYHESISLSDSDLDEIKEYKEYLEGWLETHDEAEGITIETMRGAS